MTRAPSIALLQALTLPAAEAPDWVHLLPAGTIRTVDGRGPYRVADPSALMAASLAPGDRLPIDENHAIDLAAQAGAPSPARGWIVELQSREDGIWGRVDWTPTGLALLADRAYRALSPVITHTKDGAVLGILRASLVNRPNLRGLTTLHQEDPMSLMRTLADVLGLESPTEEALVARITALHQAQPQVAALQSQIAAIGTALGVPNATAEGVTEAARALHAAHQRSEQLASQLRGEQAQRWMDAQLAAKRMIPADARAGLIALHMQDAAQAEAIAALYPSGQALPAPAPPPQGDAVALNAEQVAVARQLGISQQVFATRLKAEREESL